MILDGQNFDLYFNGSLVDKIVSIEIRDGLVEEIEHQTLAGPNLEYLPGQPEFGRINITLYRDTFDDGQQAIADAIKNSAVVPCQLDLSDGRRFEFDAFGRTIPITGVINDVETSEAVIRIASDFTQTL